MDDPIRATALTTLVGGLIWCAVRAIVRDGERGAGLPPPPPPAALDLEPGLRGDPTVLIRLLTFLMCLEEFFREFSSPPLMPASIWDRGRFGEGRGVRLAEKRQGKKKKGFFLFSFFFLFF